VLSILSTKCLFGDKGQRFQGFQLAKEKFAEALVVIPVFQQDSGGWRDVRPTFVIQSQAQEGWRYRTASGEIRGGFCL
jgi:hypothetical protein